MLKRSLRAMALRLFEGNKTKHKKENIMIQSNLASFQEVQDAYKTGNGKLAQWQYDQPELTWSARKIFNCLRSCHTVFEEAARNNMMASDQEL